MSRALRFAHARWSAHCCIRIWHVFLAVVLISVSATADASDSVERVQRSAAVQADDDAPARLIQAALRREIAGDNRKSAELLRAALREDPEYAPALWHAGYVEIDRYWVKADDPFQLAARREALKQYHQRRQDSQQTVAGQLALARWCEARDLDDQAMAHFYAVVSLDPEHRVARRRHTSR